MTSIAHDPSGRTGRQVPPLKFSTIFADETNIMTINADGFDHNTWPGCDLLYAPAAADPAALYRLHLWREAHVGPANTPRYLEPPGHEGESFAPTPQQTEFGMRR